MPYRGKNEEVRRGKKTTIELLEGKLKYEVKYTCVKSYVDEDTEEEKEIELEVEEVGTIVKEHISSVGHYIDNLIVSATEVIPIHMIAISHTGDMLTLSLEKKEEKLETYEKIYNWLYNEQ